MNAIILARVSSGRQAREGASIEAQRVNCERACAAQGWHVLRVVELPGESAYGERRPLFWAAIEAVERREVAADVVVVWELSRFARNTEVLLATMRRLTAVGVRVFEAAQGTYLDESRLVTTVRGAIAEGASADHGRRVATMKRYNRENGWFVGRVPFGYEATGERGQVRIVEAEADAIVWGSEAFARGTGYIEIAREWNRRGVRPRSTHGHEQFTESSVRAIIGSPTYLGMLRQGQRSRGITWHPGVHPPIVSADLHARVEQRRASREISRSVSSPALLSRLARCAACEHPLEVSRPDPAHVYYRCRGRGDNGCPDRPRRGHRGAAVEGPIDAMVRALWVDDAWLANVQREARSNRPPEAREATAAFEESMRRLAELYAARDITREQYQEMRARLLRERPAVAVEPERVAFGARRFESLREVWDVMTDGLRNRFLREVLLAVWVEPAGGLWVEPAAECAALFEARTRVLGEWASGGVDSLTHPVGRYPVDALIRGAA